MIDIDSDDNEVNIANGSEQHQNGDQEQQMIDGDMLVELATGTTEKAPETVKQVEVIPAWPGQVKRGTLKIIYQNVFNLNHRWNVKTNPNAIFSDADLILLTETMTTPRD